MRKHLPGRLEVYPRTRTGLSGEEPRTEYGWRLVAGNGNVIAGDQGQGYVNRDQAALMAVSIIRGDYADTTKSLSYRNRTDEEQP